MQLFYRSLDLLIAVFPFLADPKNTISVGALVEELRAIPSLEGLPALQGLLAKLEKLSGESLPPKLEE